jgi:hypothetical protein
MLLALLICRGGGGLVFAVLMAWFEGVLVLHLVYLYLFIFSLTFSSCSPKLSYFTCYTSLYLVDYTRHYARMSRDEM